MSLPRFRHGCSGCGREINVEPMAICPSLVHWRAWAEELLKWEDIDDEWTEAIKEAHPTRSDSHEEYATAMRMVGHRHSKHELVSLVNWLLVRLKDEDA